MSTELAMPAEPIEEPSEADAMQASQGGARSVGTVGTILLMMYLVVSVVLLLYMLVELWPSPNPAGGSVPSASEVYLFGAGFLATDEVRLLLIVALSGALGGLVHTLRSLYWYVGNRALVYHWLPMYIMRPFVGLTLGLVFYLVFRGGLFSSQATVQQTSPFGFAALAALVGMFSEEAVEKLKQAASMLLAEPPKGLDQAPPKPPVEAGSTLPQQRARGV